MNKILQSVFTGTVFMAVSVPAYAVMADSSPRTVTLPDGNTVTLVLHLFNYRRRQHGSVQYRQWRMGVCMRQSCRRKPCADRRAGRRRTSVSYRSEESQTGNKSRAAECRQYNAGT